MKKIFLICLAILLSIQDTTFAKEVETKKINVAIEVTDSSKHQELGTASGFEKFLGENLVEKNFVNVVNAKALPEAFPAATKSPEDIFGELLIFDAVELPVPSQTPESFEPDFYKELGAAYVIRCEVLALGVTRVEDKTVGAIFGATGGILSLIGSGNKSRDKTLRRVGWGIGLGGFIKTERTALNTVVNMKFIDVETGQILWQENFHGLAVKHHKPRKGYDDVWQQAYVESVEKAAKKVAKRVNKYVDKVIIKGESDKEFR